MCSTNDVKASWNEERISVEIILPLLRESTGLGYKVVQRLFFSTPLKIFPHIVASQRFREWEIAFLETIKTFLESSGEALRTLCKILIEYC